METVCKGPHDQLASAIFAYLNADDVSAELEWGYQTQQMYMAHRRGCFRGALEALQWLGWLSVEEVDFWICGVSQSSVSTTSLSPRQ